MDAGNMATPGMPVLSLETNGALQVTASVPETQISQIKSGTGAILTVNAAGITFSGKVSEISSSSQNSGGLYIVKINVPDNNRKNLLAGMYVNISIPVADTLNAAGTAEGILVPESSIVHKGDLDGIYTMSSDNQAILRWVRLGKRINGNVELLSGLGKLEKFVTHADGNLYNGAPIKIAE
jgi:multidrug efflux pump subunit AcrA (membrane-fusion protein)